MCRTSRASSLLFAASLLSLALACDGPRLPEQIEYRGELLKKAATWKAGGVQGVVFIPLDSEISLAPLQLGILISTERPTARELHVWIMRQYRQAQVSRWHESAASDSACKVGRTNQPLRDFVAVQLCRDRGNMAVCVEVDTPQAAVIAGPRHDWDKTRWEEVCAGQWDSHRGAMERLAERVLAQR